MARLRTVIATVLAVLGALLVAGPLAGPAQAAPPPLQLSLMIGLTPQTTDAPFVGQEVVAQSQVITGPPSAAGWRCVVSFGDGSAPVGQWRAKPWDSAAPCGGFHTYAAAGDYRLTMTVTDPSGASTTTSRSLHVTERPVTAVDAGVEGSAVTLSSSAPATWATSEPKCTVTGSGTTTATARCQDNGTFLITYDTGRAATSGGYALTYVNGAPAPVVSVLRQRNIADPVVSPTVGSGDAITVHVETRDPSTTPPSAGPPYGDGLTCRFDYGDGRTETIDVGIYDFCNGFPTYTKAGTYVITVRVTDEDGAVGTASTRLTVKRRDVQASAEGTTADGTSVDVTGALTNGRASGKMHFRLGTDRADVAKVTSVQVYWDGSVRLQGPARFDGQRGYAVDLSIGKDGAVQGALYFDNPGVYDDVDIARIDSPRGELTTLVRAPRVR